MTEQGLQTWQRLQERIQSQSWPQHTLYVVATPIGNLGDFSLRAWQALLQCDVIAAEDTRSTRPLLEAWGIQPLKPVLALHEQDLYHTYIFSMIFMPSSTAFILSGIKP